MQQAMIPIGPIIWLLLRVGGKNRAANPSRPGDHDFVPVALFVRVALLASSPCTLAPLLASLGEPGAPAVAAAERIAALLVATFLLLPGLWLDLALTRWAPPRFVALYARTLLPLRWRHDCAAGGVIEGLRALVHQAGPPGKTAESPDRSGELEGLQATLVGPVHTGLRLYAEGELARARGQHGRADAIFRLIETTTPSRDIGRTRPLARRPRIADAAATGNWKEVERLGLECHPTRAWSQTLAGASQRLRGERNAPSRSKLRWWWLRSGEWGALAPFVLAACEVLPAVEQAAEATPSDPLSLALLRHREACTGAATPERIFGATLTWEAVTSGTALEPMLARRALGLQVRTAPEVLRSSFEASIRADLGEALSRSTGPLPRLPAHPPLWQQIVADRWDLEASATERAVDGLRRRSVARTALATVDEWLEWAAVRERWERAVRFAQPGQRGALYRRLWMGPCNHAVWLVNGRQERLLAWAIFRWLSEEAEHGEEPASLELLLKNERVTR